MGKTPRHDRWLRHLVTLQSGRPAIILLIAGALTLLSIGFALRLRLYTGFASLLPQDLPSVRELDRVAQKTAGVSTLFVVLHAGDGPAGPAPPEALRRAADAVVKELEALGNPWIGSATDNIRPAIRFLEPRAGLYASVEDLKEIRAEVDARVAYEVNKELGVLFDEEAPPPLDIDALKKRLGVDALPEERYPEGYYQSQDGKVVVVAARSKIMGSDLPNGIRALELVHEAIARANLASYHPSIHYGLAGDLYTGVHELQAIKSDLTQVGVVGVLLIVGVVFLYYLRLRTLITMLVTITAGVTWTFGLTWLAIGHLNLATGFLFTIVAGNGINAGIIYMARYLEARREGAAPAEGLLIAHRETWVATLTAAIAASASYASLLITEFRGFRDFGLIGSAGMLLCWLATYFTMPALLATIERIAPLESDSRGLLTKLRRGWGRSFGRPFAALIPRAPRLITLIGVVLGALGIVGVFYYVLRDPFEYDMRKLRTSMEVRTEEVRNQTLAREITGYVGADAMAILVDRPEQVAPLKEALYAKRDAAQPGEKPFEAVHALEDFVPANQAEKIPILLDLEGKLVRAHRRGLIDEADWAKIKPYLPPKGLSPFTIDDLPEAIAQPFTEVDGTRGRIVYISPSGNTEDARYLFRWADAYRRTVLPDGSVVLGSGRAVIYADMWKSVLHAVPRVVVASLLLTVLAVIVAFRRAHLVSAVVGSLLVGVSWLIGLFALIGLKINFMNFIALPITFGIGADYAVNLVYRHAREGAGGAVTAVRETGGAVTLCSATTILGYLALVGSANHAVKSLGITAVLGEICCLLAAVLVLPAWLLWRELRHLKTLTKAQRHDDT